MQECSYIISCQHLAEAQIGTQRIENNRSRLIQSIWNVAQLFRLGQTSTEREAQEMKSEEMKKKVLEFPKNGLSTFKCKWKGENRKKISKIFTFLENSRRYSAVKAKQKGGSIFYLRVKLSPLPLKQGKDGICVTSPSTTLCAGSTRTCLHNEDVQVLR